MVKVRLAVKSQCDRIYVLGIIPADLVTSLLNTTFNLEASNLAGGTNILTAWQRSMDHKTELIQIWQKE